MGKSRRDKRQHRRKVAGTAKGSQEQRKRSRRQETRRAKGKAVTPG